MRIRLITGGAKNLQGWALQAVMSVGVLVVHEVLRK